MNYLDNKYKSGESGTYTAFGAKEIIKQDIAYRVIDAISFAGKLKSEFLYKNAAFGRTQPVFYEHFLSLYIASFMFVRNKDKKTCEEVEDVLEKVDTNPLVLVEKFKRYLEILKNSGLIEIGSFDPSFEEKLTRR